MGCVLYEAIALKPPFRANDMEGLYKKVVRGFYPHLPPDYSNDLTIVVKMMLQVAPHLRSSCGKKFAYFRQAIVISPYSKAFYRVA